MQASATTVDWIIIIAFTTAGTSYGLLRGGWPQNAKHRRGASLVMAAFTILLALALSQMERGMKLWTMFYLSSGGLLALMAFLSLIFPTRQQRAKVDTSGVRDEPRGNNPASAYPARKPRHKFADVQGMAALKKTLETASHDIGERGMNGILFSGEPGNGKTFIAEAFAGEMGCNFLEVRIGEVASKWVNQTSEQIRMAFLAARCQPPCVLFLDELDSMMRDRAHTLGGGDMEAPRITNLLLTEIADVRAHPEWGVIIVAATNHIDQLDGAGIREGRFDFKIEIPPPDFAGRIGLLKNNLPKGLAYEDGAPERAAKRWEGFSVVRCIAVAQRAARMADAANTKQIGFRTLMEALRDVQGARGINLAEGTPSLEELKFDEDIREDLRALAGRMMNIEQIEARGGAVPKGVIFGGPPGTGKTAVAKALAVTSGWAFLPTTGQELQSAPDTLDKLIDKALDLRPCIVFIDEADDILMERSANLWGKSATNKLLATLEGTRALPDVMFVAATNFPDTLDAAAIRDGRFGEQYMFRTPSQATMAEIIAQFMHEKAMASWSAEFTPQAAAALMEGMAPSDVRGRLQAAINRVAGLDNGQVTLDVLRRVL